MEMQLTSEQEGRFEAVVKAEPTPQPPWPWTPR